MNGIFHDAGSVIVPEQNEATDFEIFEENTITVMVKMASIAGDKYIGLLQLEPDNCSK